MSEVKIDGLDTVLNVLTGLVDDEAIHAALGIACATVERSAKIKAQAFKGTGELSRSIESRIEGNAGIVFTPLEYAPYVEYGTGLFAEGGNGRQDVPWSYKDDKGEWYTTSGQHPQPFMRPALYENREKIKRILKGELLSD